MASKVKPSRSTAPAPPSPRALYQKWFNEYDKLTQVQINYQAIGSGGGIKGIQDQTVDFGATDGPMTDDQLAAAKGGEIFHIPTALGAMVPPTTCPASTRSSSSPATRWPASSWATSRSGTTRSSSPITRPGQRQPGHRRRPPLGWLGHDVHLDRLPEHGQPELGGQGRQGHLGQLAGGSRRHGQRGRRRRGPAEPVLHRLRRADLRATEQPRLRPGQEQGRQVDRRRTSKASPPRPPASAAGPSPPDLRFSIVDAPGDNAFPISGSPGCSPTRTSPTAKGVALTRLLGGQPTRRRSSTRISVTRPCPMRSRRRARR